MSGSQSPPDEAYRRARMALREGRLREESGRTKPGSEMEIQARIYRGEFGLKWKGEEGEMIEVRHFGEWNREPGPDFRGAKVLIDGVGWTGDIEVDRNVRDWEDHGHAENSSFNEVILHVFFNRSSRRRFSRTREHRGVVQVCLPMTRAGHRRRLHPGGPFLDGDRVRRLIDAAAAFRLRRKGSALRRSCELGGADEAIFQAIATGLGYKNNKIPFLLVAQRAGCKRARGEAGEALLFGLAGFHRARYFDEGDDANRAYLAMLWETWWRIRDREARLVLDEADWKWAAVRPANHPHRRMGALAQVAAEWKGIRDAIDAGNVEGFSDALRGLSHPFWCRHASLARDPLPRNTALIGAERARDLVINVLLPWRDFSEGWALLGSLAGPAPGRRILRAVEWLCGDSCPSLGRSAKEQQGLLQIDEDFFGESPEDVWKAFDSGGPIA